MAVLERGLVEPAGDRLGGGQGPFARAALTRQGRAEILEAAGAELDGQGGERAVQVPELARQVVFRELVETRFGHLEAGTDEQARELAAQAAFHVAGAGGRGEEGNVALPEVPPFVRGDGPARSSASLLRSRP